MHRFDYLEDLTVTSSHTNFVLKSIETKMFLPYSSNYFFLAMLVYPHDVISCDATKVENFHYTLKYFF